MLPARINPKSNCIKPAITPAIKTSSNEPKSETPATKIAVKPAAGPDTLMGELLKQPTIRPPIIPEITPAKGGAPEANAMPKQSGRATKKTTKPEEKFDFIKWRTFMFYLYIIFQQKQ